MKETIAFMIATLLTAGAEASDTTWTLASSNTQCRIRIIEDRPVMESLGLAGASESVLAKPVQVALADESRPWKFAKGALDPKTGILQLEFVSAPLRYRQFFQAQPGPGPIRQWAEVQNDSTNAVKVTPPPCLKLPLRAADSSAWWVGRGGNNAREQGYTSTVPVTAELKERRPLGPGPKGDKTVPWLALQGAAQGLYIAWAYSGNGTLEAVADANGKEVEVAFTLAEAQLPVPPGGTLWIPPALVGCYRGDVDAGSYTLHRFYLEKLRPPLPAEYPDPMLTYNVFFGKQDEAGLMEHQQLAHEFGFEAFVPDAIWFPGSWGSYAGPWVWDTKRFPNGVKPYREFTRQNKMLLGLWCAWGRNFKDAEAVTKKIITDNELDYFKHDMGLIPGGSYDRTVGYYKVMESLRESFPRVVLENCDAGGCIKDFGAMSRAHYIVTTDDLSAMSDRMSIYDSTFVFPPRVLQAYTWLQNGEKPGPYLWRSAMMGAWVIDAPPLSGADAESVKKAVATYKSWVRPILQDCQVHHILPRPDGKRWDGMFYWGPGLKKGILFIFRPQSPEASQTVKLKGLDSAKRYKVWSEDASIAAADWSGRDLMDTGLEIKLPTINSSDLIYIKEQREPCTKTEWP